jgi:molybdenum cofactor cytidylyltransferase
VLTVAETLARQGLPLTLHPFRHCGVGLVADELPGLKDSSVTDKTIAATEQRITALTGTLLPPVRCPHDEESIARRWRVAAAGADLLLVVGASAVWTGAMSGRPGSCAPAARSCISACRSIPAT